MIDLFSESEATRVTPVSSTVSEPALNGGVKVTVLPLMVQVSPVETEAPVIVAPVIVRTRIPEHEFLPFSASANTTVALTVSLLV